MIPHRNPQIIICLDRATGSIIVEAPGKNGARLKLTSTSALLPPEYIAELHAQLDEIERAEEDDAEKAAAKLRARHNSIVSYTSSHYPSALPLIEHRVKVPPAVRLRLIADGFTHADIDLMAARGELPKSFFWSHPKPEPTSIATPADKLTIRRAKGEKRNPKAVENLHRAIASIEL